MRNVQRQEREVNVHSTAIDNNRQRQLHPSEVTDNTQIEQWDADRATDLSPLDPDQPYIRDSPDLLPVAALRRLLRSHLLKN